MQHERITLATIIQKEVFDHVFKCTLDDDFFCV